MSNTRKANRKNRKNATRKQSGGKRAPTPWTRLVQRVFKELKAKDPNARLGDAMKEASARKNEM